MKRNGTLYVLFCFVFFSERANNKFHSSQRLKKYPITISLFSLLYNISKYRSIDISSVKFLNIFFVAFSFIHICRSSKILCYFNNGDLWRFINLNPTVIYIHIYCYDLFLSIISIYINVDFL